jgi:hypothetical protein
MEDESGMVVAMISGSNFLVCCNLELLEMVAIIAV